jgi:hypothetical protein
MKNVPKEAHAGKMQEEREKLIHGAGLRKARPAASGKALAEV